MRLKLLENKTHAYFIASSFLVKPMHSRAFSNYSVVLHFCEGPILGVTIEKEKNKAQLSAGSKPATSDYDDSALPLCDNRCTKFKLRILLVASFPNNDGINVLPGTIFRISHPNRTNILSTVLLMMSSLTTPPFLASS